MIEITVSNPERQTISDIAPFAWIDWPRIAINQALFQMKQAARIVKTGTYTVGKTILTGHGKYVIIHPGGIDDPSKREVVKPYGLFPPVVTTERYLSREDFERELANRARNAP